MPVIARFYGIVIKMYFSQSEHGIPHFHAIYGEFNAVLGIKTQEVMEGDLPVRDPAVGEGMGRALCGSCWTCGTGRSFGSSRDWSNQTMDGVPRVVHVEPVARPSCSFDSRTVSRRSTTAARCLPARRFACLPTQPSSVPSKSIRGATVSLGATTSI